MMLFKTVYFIFKAPEPVVSAKPMSAESEGSIAGPNVGAIVNPVQVQEINDLINILEKLNKILFGFRLQNQK